MVKSNIFKMEILPNGECSLVLLTNFLTKVAKVFGDISSYFENITI